MQACCNPAEHDDYGSLAAADWAVPTHATQMWRSVSETELPSCAPLPAAGQLEDTPVKLQQLSIQESFAGRTVLLTGVTGFVGSLVLEQLLRTCPTIHKVYVIVRQKHGISGLDRLHRLVCTNPLFNLLRASCTAPCCTGSSSHGPLSLGDSSCVNDLETPGCDGPHVEAILGDMTLPGYGIAHADLLKVQQQTEIVIHAAASISFDDHIHDAISHNYTVGCTRCSPIPKHVSVRGILLICTEENCALQHGLLTISMHVTCAGRNQRQCVIY